MQHLPNLEVYEIILGRQNFISKVKFKFKNQWKIFTSFESVFQKQLAHQTLNFMNVIAY